jgi:hypothetical protein
MRLRVTLIWSVWQNWNMLRPLYTDGAGRGSLLQLTRSALHSLSPLERTWGRTRTHTAPRMRRAHTYTHTHMHTHTTHRAWLKPHRDSTSHPSPSIRPRVRSLQSPHCTRTTWHNCGARCSSTAAAAAAESIKVSVALLETAVLGDLHRP